MNLCSLCAFDLTVRTVAYSTRDVEIVLEY